MSDKDALSHYMEATGRMRERAEQAEQKRDQLQEAVDRAVGVMRESEYVGGPTEREAWKETMRVLGPLATVHKGQPSKKERP